MSNVNATQEEIDRLQETLLNRSGKFSLSVRFRALFTLKNIGTDAAVKAIGDVLRPETVICQDPQALLGHELAYCLGQIGRPSAIPVLAATLRDKCVHPMVRHEAAEAIGAIGDRDALPILQDFSCDSNMTVRESCIVAIEKLHHETEESKGKGMYGTIDPAPSLLRKFPKNEDGSVIITREDVLKMKEHLTTRRRSIYDRYQALFGLRDLLCPQLCNDPEIHRLVIDVLVSGFTDDSALFRHEVAYVFGQLCDNRTVPMLLTVLSDKSEDEMVRHEAAEALGSIATPQCLPSLKFFSHPDEQSTVVRESCEVALDMYQHAHSEEFQYTMPLRSPLQNH